MTTAETNNERATVEEFEERLEALIEDARAAGLPVVLVHSALLRADDLLINELWLKATAKEAAGTIAPAEREGE